MASDGHVAEVQKHQGEVISSSPAHVHNPPAHQHESAVPPSHRAQEAHHPHAVHHAQKQQPWDAAIKKMRAYSVYRSAIILLAISIALSLLGTQQDFQLAVAFLLAQSIVAAVAIEFALSWLFRRKAAFSESALICGIIIGSILQPGTGTFAIVAVCAIAIASKYLLRISGSQIFNPAAFGLLAGNLFFGTLDAWWAATPLLFLAIATAFVAWKMNKWILEVSFLVFWIGALAAKALLVGAPLSLPLIAGFLPLFLTAFMLTEPRTSPMLVPRQAIIGAFIGLAGVLLLLAQGPADMVIVALLAGNLLTKLLVVFKVGAKQ